MLPEMGIVMVTFNECLCIISGTMAAYISCKEQMDTGKASSLHPVKIVASGQSTQRGAAMLLKCIQMGTRIYIGTLHDPQPHNNGAIRTISY